MKYRDGIPYYHTTLYQKWQSMINRCESKKNSNFRRYGGRGIKVCDEWKNDFFAFKKWADENGYKKGLEIDRIDNDGNYCPENCRFVTSRENCNNKSTNVHIEKDGKEYTLSQFAVKYQLKYTNVCKYHKMGIPADEIISKDRSMKRRQKFKIIYNTKGETK